MWKLFDWFTNKFEKLDPNDQHNGLNHLSQINSRRRAGTADSACCTASSDELEQLTDNQLQRTNRPKPRPDSETRQDGMAYWRMNTRREQPSDSLIKSRMTQTGQWHAFPAAGSNGTRAGQTFTPTVGESLDSLQYSIKDVARSNLNSSYIHKSQAALEMRRLGYGVDNYATQRIGLANYPHYEGSWEPAHLDDNGFVTATDADKEPVSSSFSAEPVSGPSFMNENEMFMNENQVPIELAESLKSVESSPQCDALFEQSAQTYAQTQSQLQENNEQDFNYPALKDSLAEQSTTVDSFPSMQMSEIQIAVADHPDTTSDVLFQLAHDTNPDVRFAIAENHKADIEILQLLSQDDNPFVAARARKTLRRLQNGQCMQGNFASFEQRLRKAN
ncbi:MAG TPA: HEAT repeat domain-containing protein [Oculatellaceae cyanobacterium]